MKRAAICLVSLAAACGSPSTAEVDALIQQMATESCAWEFRCCKDMEITQLDARKFSTESACVPYRVLALQSSLYLHRLAASEGRLKVDADVAAACVAQLQAKACNPKPGAPATTNPMTMVDACADVFMGTTGAGHDCIYTTECEKGSRCVSDSNAVGRGVCVPYQEEGEICNADADCDPHVPNLYCAKADYKCHVRASFGGACLWTSDASGNATVPLLLECDAKVGNLYCDPVGSTCKQLPVDGDPCLSPLPPGVGYACNPDPKLQLVCETTGIGTTGGTCHGPATVGESCQGRTCAVDLYCDTATYKCKDLPGFGQTCTTSSYRCLAPYFCNTSKSPYVCDQPASIGEACVTPTPRTCNTDAYCDSGTGGSKLCEPKLPDGTSCATAIQCESGVCGVAATGVTTKTCLENLNGVQCVGR